MTRRSGAALAFARFQVASGVRMSLRAAAPFSGIVVVVVGVAADPAAFLEELSWALGRTDGGASMPLVLAAAMMGLADSAYPRLAPSLSSWLRHLPMDGASVRRGLIASLVVAASPALVLWVLLWLHAAGTGAAPALSRLAAAPVAAVGAALIVLPARRRFLSAPAGGLAILASSLGSAPSVAVGAVLAAVGERLAGRANEPRRWRAPTGFGRAPIPVPAAIALRAIGGGILGSYAAASLPLFAAYAFVHNNRLPPSATSSAIRFGAGVAIAVFLSLSASLLAVRRPPWPWSRSLPWSAAARVLSDATVLAALAAPLVVAALFLDPAAPIALVPALAVVAVRAASAMRRFAEARTGPGGPIFLESFVVAAWTAVTAWTAIACLLALAPAVRIAAREEKDAKVGRWA